MPARLNQRAKEAVSEEEGGGERNLSPATPTPFLSLPRPSLQALPYLPFLGNSRPSHYLTSSLSRLPPFLSPPRPSFSPCSPSPSSHHSCIFHLVSNPLVPPSLILPSLPSLLLSFSPSASIVHSSLPASPLPHFPVSLSSI